MPDPIVAQANAASSAPDSSGADKVRAAMEGLGSATGEAHEITVEPESTITEQEQAQVQIPEPQGDDTQPAEGSIEHKMQSWLGRKMAKRDDDLKSEIRGLLDGYFANLPQPQQPPQQAYTPKIELPDFGEDLDEIVTTKREVLELAERRETVKAQQENVFWNNYSQTLTGLGNQYRLNPDQVKEMAQAIATAGNQRTHGDPTVAAQLNFHKAYVSLLQRQAASTKPSIPVSGNVPISATGIATAQKTDTGAPETISLDHEAERVRRAFGLSDATVKKVVKQNKR